MHGQPAYPTSGKRTGDSRQARVAGFSLLEVVFVVVLIAIVASIGLGRFSGSVGHHGLEASAQRVMADIELARQKAVALSNSRTVTFSTVNSTYVLNGVTDINRAGQAYTVSLNQAPYEARIQSVSLDGSGGATLTFNGWGQPVLANTSSTTPYLVLGGRGRSIIIALDPGTGRAYVASAIPSGPTASAS
jgi:prepilin-type N-terminal cleavage/methylation domain-containing protein